MKPAQEPDGERVRGRERKREKERKREESKKKQKKKKQRMPEKKKMKWGFKGAGDNETIRVYCMNDVKRGERKS